MKKLFSLSVFLLCAVLVQAQYNPSNFTVTNKAMGIAQAVPTDARSYFYDASLFIMRPYQSTAEACSYLNLVKYRKGSFPVYINTGALQSDGTFIEGTILEYWFKNGTANADLVLKQVAESDPKRVTGIAITGTTTKTVTLTLADATTVTGSFTDLSADSTTYATNYDVDSAKANLRAATALREASANKGVANGYAPLNGATKIDPTYLPTGSTTYKGTWDASANSPTLADGTGSAGWTYTVSTAGTKNLGSGSITWAVGDQAIHNGTIYQRSPSGAAVASVNGKTGTVVIDKTDVGLSNVNNTTDASKPISTATATALAGKADQSALVDTAARLQTDKVDKVSGKQLSTEDYTTTEKTKLAGLSNADLSPYKTITAHNADTTTLGTELRTKINTTNTAVATKQPLLPTQTGLTDYILSTTGTNIVWRKETGRNDSVVHVYPGEVPQRKLNMVPSGGKLIFEPGLHVVTLDTLNAVMAVTRSNITIEVPKGAYIKLRDSSNAKIDSVEISRNYLTVNGLDDISAQSTAHPPADSIDIVVKITGTGTPNTFAYSVAGGAYSSNANITGGFQTLANNIQVKFNSTTGHTLNDSWYLLTSSTPATIIQVGSGFQTDSILNTVIFGEGILDPNSSKQYKVHELAAQSNYTVGVIGRVNNTTISGLTIINGERSIFASGRNSGTFNLDGTTTGGTSYDVNGLRISGIHSYANRCGFLFGHPQYRGYTKNVVVTNCYIEATGTALEPNHRLQGFVITSNNIISTGSYAIHMWRGPENGMIANNNITGTFADNAPSSWYRSGSVNVSSILSPSSTNYLSSALGVGAKTPTAIIHAQSASFPVMLAERTTTTGTNGVSGALAYRLTTGLTMASGFGSSLVGQVAGIGGTVRSLTQIQTVRTTNDSTGDLVIQTMLNGTLSEKGRFKSSGELILGNDTAATRAYARSVSGTGGVSSADSSTFSTNYRRDTAIANLRAAVATAGGSYTLPIASSSVLGGIKVGAGLAINSSTGVLTSSGSTGDSTTYSTNYRRDTAIAAIGQWNAYVPTLVGFSVLPSTIVSRYTLIGKTCTYFLNTSTGTSNSATFTTTLPFAAANSGSQQVATVATMGATLGTGRAFTTTSSNVLTLTPNFTTSSWATTGNKAVIFTLTYEIL